MRYLPRVRLIDALASRTPALRDPGLRSALVLLLVVCAGFALWGLAWRGAAREVYVPFQLPWLISAGMGGVALIGTAVAALHIHLGRRAAAAERAVTDDLVRTAFALIDELGAREQPRRGTRR